VEEPQHPLLRFDERLIFASRYLLIPIYLGLILAQIAYTGKFICEVYPVLSHFWRSDETEIMLMVLTLIDMAMVANLISMVIIGSYSAFINDLSLGKGRRPSWLKHISSGLLKIKMGTSLVGISLIHLLRTFINIEQTSWTVIYKQLWIIGTFVIASFALSVIESLNHKNDTH
jgi:uncharacterized protein (TIGR00645 family)